MRVTVSSGLGSWLACVIALAGCSTVLEGGDEPRPGAGADAAPPVAIADAQPLPALRVDYADPDHGPFVGGTEVVLRGRGFVAGMTVTVGGKLVEAIDLEVIDGNRAVILTPAGAPGQADIHIVAGEHETTREDVFLYEPIYLEPRTGAIAGGTYVRVRGLGTSFAPSDIVLLDGRAMSGVQVINGQELIGYTPAGVAGGADVRVVSALGGELFAEDGFTYETTVDPLFAGMGGGPIEGSLNVTLVDAFTEDGIEMAVVALGDPETTPYWGVTDPFGQVTISAPGLAGPVTLTAGHPRYESGAMVGFDARNLAMFLQPLPPDPTEIPPSGPFPPGRAPGRVSGDVVFGGTTGIGTTDWDLVPEPTSETQRKRTYVFTTARDIFSLDPNPGPGGTIDFVPGASAWEYSIAVRPTAFALVALAGLYEDVDPDGSGPLPRGVFTPYAMGVQRNVLVGPGETLENVSIAINIPLDSGMKVELPDAPALQPAGDMGPDEYRVNAILDLGGEGVIRLPGSRALFRDRRSTVLTALAPIAGAISDASYTIAAGAYSADGSPYSIRILRGVRDLSRPVVVAGFIGAQRAVDPPDRGTTQARHLVVALDGGAQLPTFRQYRLINLDNGHPVWRVISRGDLDEVPLHRLTRFGLPEMTTSELYWSATSVHIPGASFDTFNYGQLNANYWHAYSVATFDVAFQ
jgi:hypothetical protein